MKNLHRPYHGLNDFRLSGDTVGHQGRGDNVNIGVTLAKGAENNQTTGKQRAKDDQFAGFGFKKIKEITGFHGWPLGERMGRTGTLVVVMTAGGGGGDDNRFKSTMN